MAQLNHNVDQNNAQEGFDLIPAGVYTAIIEESEIVVPKSGQGQMLKLTYQIIDGPFKGQKLFNNLMLQHSSQQAVNIATRTLNAIGLAVGVSQIQDSAQLHKIPMYIEVIIKNSKDFGEQNGIKKHFSLNSLAQGQSIDQQAAPQAGQQNDAKQPWER